MQNNQKKNIGDQLSTKHPIGLKDNSIRDQKSMPILLTEILVFFSWWLINLHFVESWTGWWNHILPQFGVG